MRLPRGSRGLLTTAAATAGALSGWDKAPTALQWATLTALVLVTSLSYAVGSETAPDFKKMRSVRMLRTAP